MTSKHLLLSLVITLCLAGLYQLVNTGKNEYPEYNLSVGQMSDFDLYAPFDFPIFKSEEQVKQEYDDIIHNLEHQYIIDPEVEYTAFSNLNELFEYIYSAQRIEDITQTIRIAGQSGYVLTPAMFSLTSSREKTEASYNLIRTQLELIYSTGVYKTASTSKILVETSTNIVRKNIDQYYSVEQAKQIISDRINSLPSADLIFETNAHKLIIPNLRLNQSALQKARKDAMASMDLTSGTVQQNEVIIKKNRKLTESDIRKLDSLTREYQNRGERRSPIIQFLSFAGLLIYLLSIILIFNYIGSIQSKEEIRSILGAIVTNLGFLVLIALTIFTNQIINIGLIHIPLGVLTVSSVILLGIDFAILYGTTGLLLMLPFVGWDSSLIALLFVSELLALALVSYFKTKNDFLRIWFYLFLSHLILNIAFMSQSITGLNIQDDIQKLLRDSGYLMVSTSVSALGCVAIVSFFESRWNRATKQVLLELLDFEHPLLRKLASEASGTYHHSLIVGNLAEGAAQAIGSNPLLARVGSYYHDIGKTVYPDLFTENNENATELHSRMSPTESAEVIRSHVREGLALAKKYKIPTAVKDIIEQHHGSGYIRYFLDVATRQGDVSDITAFKYPGPLPKSKEAVLVMLSDVVESTTKAKNDLTESEIQKIVEDTCQRLIKEGQFEESPITLGDLSLAKASMITLLQSIYRKRLDYSDEK